MEDVKDKPLSMSESLSALRKAFENVMTHFVSIEKDDAPTLLRSFKLFKEQKEELDDLQKIVSGFYNTLSYDRIPETFERLGVDSIKLSGRNFIVGVRFNASIPSDKVEEGHAWLKENGLGALIKETVNAKSLSSAISTFVEENAIEPPKEAITIHKQRYTSVRKV